MSDYDEEMNTTDMTLSLNVSLGIPEGKSEEDVKREFYAFAKDYIDDPYSEIWELMDDIVIMDSSVVPEE